MEYKQVILVRHDLKLPKGKLGAQCGHAAVEAVLRSSKEAVKKWRDGGQKKVVLRVDDERMLFKYEGIAKQAGVITAVISDAGRTCVEPGTITCCALGPDSEDMIDRITKDLKLL